MKHSYFSLFGGVVFLTLFPGYFFYHSAVAGALFPPVLGGFFGPMSVVLGIPLLILGFGALIVGRERTLFIDQAFFLYVSFVTAWSSLHYLFGTGVQESFPFYMYNLSTIFLWLVVYVAVRSFDLNGKWLRWILSLSLLYFLAVAAWNSDGQFYDTERVVGDAVRVSGYQGLARSAAVVALVLLALNRGLRGALIVVITVPLLFLLGARSEFMGFLVVAAVLFGIREGALRTTLIWVPLGIACVAYLAVNFEVFDGSSRILQLLEIRESTSYQARNELLGYAVKTIGEHPLLGSYGSQMYLGEMGAYAHNALSAWVSYGLVGFLGFVLLLGYALVQSARLARKGYAADPQVALALAFSVYAVTLAATAKSVNDPIFALAWGATACALDKRRRAGKPPQTVRRARSHEADRDARSPRPAGR
ncbi:O-antigen ligase family protein [Cupriavidus necator]